MPTGGSPLSAQSPTMRREDPRAATLFEGAGEVRALLRQIDWSQTSLGPVSSWPESLRLPVSLCVKSRISMSIWWGPDQILIYNDSYAPILGKRHPAALGRPAREVWADVWAVISPQLEAVARGESTLNERNLVPTDRNGVLEEAWFTWAYTPILDVDGKFLGSFVVCTEDTKNVRREQELLETRDRLAVTLEAAEVGHWSLDAVTNLVVADANLARAFSVSVEAAARGVPLQVFTDSIHVADRSQTIAAITESMAKRNTFEAEYRLAPQKGFVRWVIARGRVARDASGRAVTMSGVTIDITERKRSEQMVMAQNAVLQLMASETSLPRILEELVRHVESGGGETVSSILLIDTEGRLRHGAAPSLPEAYNQVVDGIQIGENVGTCGRAAFLREVVVTRDLATDPNWAPLKKEVAALGLKAAWSVPILSVKGKVLGTFGTYFREMREPTEAERSTVDFLSKTAALAIERAQAYEELRQRDERFRQIADTLPQIVWGAGKDGVLDYYNRRWFEYVALPETDLEAARWDKYIHPDDLSITYETWQAALQTGKIYQMEFRVRDAHGKYHWFLTRALPVRDHEGKIVRWLGTCTDIDDRKAIQEENLEMIKRERAARLVSENAGRMKDDFLATLSHELRTPLNPVLLLASEGAADPELPAQVRADFESIAKNVALEARLIDDLLDLTRITRGKLALSVGPADLHTVLRDALATVASEVADKKIKVVVSFATAGALVLGDGVRLQQVFWNILRNAVKFTPEGGSITLTTGITADQKRVQVLIADSGMGMNPDEVGRLFNAFVQGDHAGGSGSHRFGGLGLGLAISRMLVELHSGRISGASEGSGRGSTFSVELPLGDRASFSPFPADDSVGVRANFSREIRPNRILLVEDHEPTRLSLKQLLLRRHYTVTDARTVEAARGLAAAQTFDLLVTDIGLPDGDGYELMRELRKKFSIQGIALTGYGMQGDIEKSRIAGFAAHLTKPVRVQDLDSALALTAAVASRG